MILRGVIKIFYWWDGDLKFYSGEGLKILQKRGLTIKRWRKTGRGLRVVRKL